MKKLLCLLFCLSYFSFPQSVIATEAASEQKLQEVDWTVSKEEEPSEEFNMLRRGEAYFRQFNPLANGGGAKAEGGEKVLEGGARVRDITFKLSILLKKTAEYYYFRDWSNKTAYTRGQFYFQLEISPPDKDILGKKESFDKHCTSRDLCYWLDQESGKDILTVDYTVEQCLFMRGDSKYEASKAEVWKEVNGGGSALIKSSDIGGQRRVNCHEFGEFMVDFQLILKTFGFTLSQKDQLDIFTFFFEKRYVYHFFPNLISMEEALDSIIDERDLFIEMAQFPLAERPKVLEDYVRRNLSKQFVYLLFLKKVMESCPASFDPTRSNKLITDYEVEKARLDLETEDRIREAERLKIEGLRQKIASAIKQSQTIDSQECRQVYDYLSCKKGGQGAREFIKSLVRKKQRPIIDTLDLSSDPALLIQFICGLRNLSASAS